MGRLNKERQEELEPKRIKTTLEELKKKGFEILEVDNRKIKLKSKQDNVITFYPYSGWFTGKGINDGRGFKNLILELEK